MQGTQTVSLDTSKSPCVCKFDCFFVQQFHLTTSLACLTRSPGKWLLLRCVARCSLGVSFTFSLLKPTKGQLAISESQKLQYLGKYKID